MEGIILQIGKQCHKFEHVPNQAAQVVSIGRAFKNDVIIADPYVAPFHLQIVLNPDGWQLQLQDQTNPIFHNQKTTHETTFLLRSGDSLTIGKTLIKIFSENHTVEKTRQFAFANWLTSSRFKWLIALVTWMMTFVLSAATIWLYADAEVEWDKLVAEALIAPTLVIAWSAIWSLTGKLLRHHHYCLSHLFLTSIVVCLAIILDGLNDYVDYIFSGLLFAYIVDYLVITILLSLLISFNLSLSTNIRRTFLTALTVNVCVIGVASLISHLDQNDFSNKPSHTQSIKPPIVLTIDAISPEAHIDNYQDIIDQLKEEEVKE